MSARDAAAFTATVSNHPLFHLLIDQPHGVIAHAQAYAALANAEVDVLADTWKHQFLLIATALCSGGVAVVLAGVALMLWAVAPTVAVEATWALVAVPLVPAMVAVGCLLAARACGERPAFGNLKAQWQADLQRLRQMETPS